MEAAPSPQTAGGSRLSFPSSGGQGLIEHYHNIDLHFTSHSGNHQQVSMQILDVIPVP